MLQTLFYIPATIGGVPLFGWGVLLGLWLAFSAASLIRRLRREGASGDLAGDLGVTVLVAAAIVYVAPQIMERDAAGEPLGIAIRGYGVMLLSGIVAGVALALHRARRVGVAAEVIYSLGLWLFVGGMVGARAFYVVEYWEQFQYDTLGETLGAVVNMTRGGLVVFGGLIGGLIAMLAFAHRRKLPLWPLADLTAPCMTLGLALGRVGCFFNGCCFGDVCALPWGVEFPPLSPPHVRQIEQGRVFGFTLTADAASAPTIVAVDAGSPAEAAGLKVGESVRRIDGKPIAKLAEAREIIFKAFRDGRLPITLTTDGGTRVVESLPGLREHSLQVHPAQLYSAIDALLTTLLLLAFDPLRRRDGETFALLLTVHPVSRFLLEIIRIDEPAVFGTGFSISQNISLLLLGGAVALWIYLERQPAKLWHAAA